MMRDPLPFPPHPIIAPSGGAPCDSTVKGRLIPALNPCWRLWLREEGPLQLMCLAQLGQELWSVQTDGRSFYLCHDRKVRRVSDEFAEAMRRDLHAVRGGFVREFRIRLSAPVPSQEIFGRDRGAGPLAVTATPRDSMLREALRVTAHGTAVPAASTEPTAPARNDVQISYRRRRHVGHYVAHA